MQVSPSELEGVLLTHPTIADAAVVGIPDIECGELPAALLVLKPETSLSVDEVKEFVAGYYYSSDYTCIR